jgi:hypothetical protein
MRSPATQGYDGEDENQPNRLPSEQWREQDSAGKTQSSPAPMQPLASDHAGERDREKRCDQKLDPVLEQLRPGVGKSACGFDPSVPGLAFIEHRRFLS